VRRVVYAERRRTQRTGGTDQALAQSRAGGEAAQIIMRNTRSTATAQPATGRGRRRAQAARLCDGRSLPNRVAAVGIVCCAHTTDDGDGHRRMQAECALPAACPSEACAATFVDFYDDCGGELVGQLGQYTSLYESCQGMRQGSSSIAMQLGVECTEDGVSDGDCVPECAAEVHGFLLLLNIDGNDRKFSCQLHHNLYSWIGGASDGGYLGKDHRAFISAIIAGAAGTYFLTLMVSRRAARLSLWPHLSPQFLTHTANAGDPPLH
jgi:hypothetical protein